MSLKSIAFRIDTKHKVLILLELNDKRLVVYSDDKIIRIYKKSLSLEYCIKDINSLIKSMIQTKDEKLICCSYEITIIKLYKTHYEIIQVIKNWTNKIIELTNINGNNINNDLLALQNNYIRVYNFSEKSHLYNSNYEYNFKDNVNNLIYLKNNDYAIILDDYFKNISLKIYNLELKKIKIDLYTIKTKESGDMFILKNKYLIVSLYLYLILVDIQDEYKISHVIKTSFGCVNSFCSGQNNIFFSGDDIGDLIEWKIENNKIIKIKEYNCSKKEINSIIKYNKNSWIATGANDGIIKFYETNY